MNKFFVPKDIYLPRYNRNCSTYLKNKEIKYTKNAVQKQNSGNYKTNQNSKKYP